MSNGGVAEHGIVDVEAMVMGPAAASGDGAAACGLEEFVGDPIRHRGPEAESQLHVPQQAMWVVGALGHMLAHQAWRAFRGMWARQLLEDFQVRLVPHDMWARQQLEG